MVLPDLRVLLLAGLEMHQHRGIALSLSSSKLSLCASLEPEGLCGGVGQFPFPGGNSS